MSINRGFGRGGRSGRGYRGGGGRGRLIVPSLSEPVALPALREEDVNGAVPCDEGISSIEVDDTATLAAHLALRPKRKLHPGIGICGKIEHYREIARLKNELDNLKREVRIAETRGETLEDEKKELLATARRKDAEALKLFVAMKHTEQSSRSLTEDVAFLQTHMKVKFALADRVVAILREMFRISASKKKHAAECQPLLDEGDSLAWHVKRAERNDMLKDAKVLDDKLGRVTARLLAAETCRDEAASRLVATKVELLEAAADFDQAVASFDRATATEGIINEQRKYADLALQFGGYVVAIAISDVGEQWHPSSRFDRRGMQEPRPTLTKFLSNCLSSWTRAGGWMS